MVAHHFQGLNSLGQANPDKVILRSIRVPLLRSAPNFSATMMVLTIEYSSSGCAFQLHCSICLVILC